jgi:hypothetical protein
MTGSPSLKELPRNSSESPESNDPEAGVYSIVDVRDLGSPTTRVIAALQASPGNCNHRTECAFWVWLLVPLPWLGDERMKGSTDRRIRSARVSSAVENLHTMVRPSIFTKLITSLSVSFGFNIASIVGGGKLPSPRGGFWRFTVLVNPDSRVCIGHLLYCLSLSALLLAVS